MILFKIYFIILNKHIIKKILTDLKYISDIILEYGDEISYKINITKVNKTSEICSLMGGY